MYVLRDLLVCGPVVFTTAIFRDAGWALPLVVGVLLYGFLRLLSELTGVEQAVRDRRSTKDAVTVAQRAKRAAHRGSGARDRSRRDSS